MRSWQILMISAVMASTSAARDKGAPTNVFRTNQAVYAKLAGKIERIWDVLIRQTVRGLNTEPGVPANCATLILLWPGQPDKLGRVYQLSKHVAETPHLNAIAYLLRVSDSHAWMFLHVAEGWRIHPATISKRGHIEVDLHHLATVTDLQDLQNQFTPGEKGTTTVLSQQFTTTELNLSGALK